MRHAVSVPSSGDYQFLRPRHDRYTLPSCGFRPLIRGLSISSNWNKATRHTHSSFRPLIRGLSISSYALLILDQYGSPFPSPHPGIINFFASCGHAWLSAGVVSVPSSGDYQFLRRRQSRRHCRGLVSVPSSGDYQFLRSYWWRGCRLDCQFPSPHPGIINFFFRSV